MSFIQKSFINICGSGFISILYFVNGIVLARILSPNGLGQYALVISTTTILSVFLSMGIGNATIYYINNQKSDPLLITTLMIKYCLRVGLILVVVLFITFQCQNYFGTIPFWAVVAISVYGIGILLTENLNQVQMAFLHVEKHVMVRLLPILILLILASIGYLTGYFSVNLAWVCTAFGQICGLFLLIFFIRGWIGRKIAFKWEKIQPILRYGLKLNSSYVLHLLHMQLGVFFVRYFISDFAEVGYFRISVRLGGILIIFVNGMAPLLYSKWASVDEKERRIQVERVSRVYFLISLIAIVSLEALADQFIPLIYGNKYIAAIPIFKILLIGMGAGSLMSPFFQMFRSSGKPLLISLVLSINLIILILLMWMLVPSNGGVGAAIAFTISNCVALLISYTLCSFKFGVKISRCFLIKKSDLLPI